MGTTFEDRVRKTGLRLYQLAEGKKPSLFKKDYWTGKVMDWSMKNEAFKQEMFRFVDVFPYLNRPELVARHIQEYFCRPGQDFPKSMQWGLKMVKPDSIVAKMAAKSITKNINAMGKQFITGANLGEAAPVMKKLRDQGVAWTVKILKEAVTSRKDEEAFLTQQVAFLEELHHIQAQWPALGGATGDLDWGFTPKNNISLMGSCLFSQYVSKACAFDYAVDMAKERLRLIYRKAVEVGAYVMMDIEHLPARAFTMAVFKGINEEPEFRDYPHKGIAFQTYFQDCESILEDLLIWSRKAGQNFGIRLVKGAFWDEEVVLANQHNYPIPVFTDKNKTDAAYEKCVRMILENQAHTALKCASHNIRSVACAIETARELKVPEERLEFQMLHGMAENLRAAWIKAGLHLRLYAPVGEIIPGMAYLVRRLLENTSNESFLRQSFADGVEKSALLKNPAEDKKDDLKPETDEKGTPDGKRGPFGHQPPIEWTEGNRRAFSKALKRLRKGLPRHIPLIIGGEEVHTSGEMRSTNPNHPDELIAASASAGVDETEQAVATAKTAWPSWRRTPIPARADILFKSVEIIRKKRHGLAALLVFEGGKNWNEAHGEIVAGMDLLAYYAREMLRLAMPIPTAAIAGEAAQLGYIPRGVGLVMAPWYSPLSSALGMASAALVTGNTVVYKPASQVPAVGRAVYDIFDEAGLPKGVLNFLPGTGNHVGDVLVTHADIAFIAFAGHGDKGLEIIEKAGKIGPHGEYIKPVIAEMGGNNAIIVDADADLDEAVGYIMNSAFSYQGQKRASCSRLIVLDEVYDRLLEVLENAVRSLIIGASEDPRTDIGAVIDEVAMEKLETYIEIGRQEGTLLVQPTAGDARGHVVPPAVFTDIKADSRLAQEEIFGPLLCVIKAHSFDEALDVANNSRFAFAGGVFSRSPGNIEKARRTFQVGSLYINRAIVGALVQRHPSGGFKRSGKGDKAMGPDYLPRFMLRKTIVENTFRSGFAPMTVE